MPPRPPWPGCLGSYRFGRYREADTERPALALSEGIDGQRSPASPRRWRADATS